MREYTHIGGGILFYVLLAFLINIPITIICVFASGFIAIFPDIIDKLIGEHRSFGHSFVWIIPFILVSFVNFQLGLAMIVGFVSHIFFDIFTTHGDPLLFPLTKIPFVSLSLRNRIQTATTMEKALFIFLMVLLIPTILLATGHFSIPMPGDVSLMGTGEAQGVPTNSHNLGTLGKNKNININLQVNSNSPKIISVQDVNENQSIISVNDSKQGA